MDEQTITTKTKILNAALEIAANKGLSNTSLRDIANAVGIKTSSLYNHFSSREELILSLYEYLREMAKNNIKNIPNLDDFIGKTEAEFVIKILVHNYIEMTTKSKLSQFYRIVESEKYYDYNAAKIILEETERMHSQIKNLFVSMMKYRKLEISDMETAVTIFASTIHEMITIYILCQRIEEHPEKWKVKMDSFIKGFVLLYKPKDK